MDSLTKIIKGVPIEELSTFIHKEESLIYEKYNMIGNPRSRSYIHSVSIANSMLQIGDDKVREYFISDKLKVLIYEKRNSFNSIDLYVTDFGETNILGSDIAIQLYNARGK